MNHLPPVADADADADADVENRWHLPNHAHVVVYERGSGARGLLTIYDCGAAQKPPSAQLLGRLEAVDARAEIEDTPTGRVVSLREPGVLESLDGDGYRIRRR